MANVLNFGLKNPRSEGVPLKLEHRILSIGKHWVRKPSRCVYHFPSICLIRQETRIIPRQTCRDVCILELLNLSTFVFSQW